MCLADVKMWVLEAINNKVDFNKIAYLVFQPMWKPYDNFRTYRLFSKLHILNNIYSYWEYLA